MPVEMPEHYVFHPTRTVEVGVSDTMAAFVCVTRSRCRCARPGLAAALRSSQPVPAWPFWLWLLHLLPSAASVKTKN